jgi:hypothetical protein
MDQRGTGGIWGGVTQPAYTSFYLYLKTTETVFLNFGYFLYVFRPSSTRAFYFNFLYKNLAWPHFYQCWNSTTIKTACNSTHQSGRSQHIYANKRIFNFFLKGTVQPDRNSAPSMEGL